MIAAHIFMAILSAWRITELFTQDQVTSWIRKRWKHYFWTCGRCVSVWSGIITTIMFYVAPFMNWPFAISMTFLIMAIATSRFAHSNHQRKIVIFPDQQRVDWGGFEKQFVLNTLKQAQASIERAQNYEDALNGLRRR